MILDKDIIVNSFTIIDEKGYRSENVAMMKVSVLRERLKETIKKGKLSKRMDGSWRIEFNIEDLKKDFGVILEEEYKEMLVSCDVESMNSILEDKE